MALLVQSIQSRNLGEENHPCFIYIDEAGPIIDKLITNALETLREYKAGITLAFQSLSQVPSAFEHSIITNTGTKYLAGLSAKDARALADDVQTDYLNLLTQPRLTFYRHVRGEHRDTLTVTPGFLKKLPKRKDLKQVLERNREKYCITEYEKPAPKLYAVQDENATCDDLEDLNKV